jgi:hypothetical protein
MRRIPLSTGSFTGGADAPCSAILRGSAPCAGCGRHLLVSGPDTPAFQPGLAQKNMPVPVPGDKSSNELLV